MTQNKEKEKILELINSVDADDNLLGAILAVRLLGMEGCKAIYNDHPPHNQLKHNLPLKWVDGGEYVLLFGYQGYVLFVDKNNPDFNDVGNEFQSDYPNMYLERGDTIIYANEY